MFTGNIHFDAPYCARSLILRLTSWLLDLRLRNERCDKVVQLVGGLGQLVRGPGQALSRLIVVVLGKDRSIQWTFYLSNH